MVSEEEPNRTKNPILQYRSGIIKVVGTFARGVQRLMIFQTEIELQLIKLVVRSHL
jgi:hypothetical protein